MATIYNNLDNYLNNHEPIDSALLSQIETSSAFHKWNKEDFKVFKDSANGYFHIPKDIIIKTEKKVGLTTIATGCKASEDAILKSTSAPFSRSTITALYTANANIKFYSSTPDDYLVYKNFDDGFNYQQTYSVATYPWIKLDTGSYRDRMGDWDLNGNVEINTQQALCRSLKEAYKINGEGVWPGTYEGFIFAENHDTKIDQGEWKVYPPELTRNTVDEQIDYDQVKKKYVYKWPQLDYLFVNKYITSCDIEPVIGAANAPYQFSDKYLTKFAKTKPADPESRKVEKRGFTSLQTFGKILQKPIETFDKPSIQFLTVSVDDNEPDKCNITADYDNLSQKRWNKIPNGRTLGIMIRLPSDSWRQYTEERLERPRPHIPPIQLQWYSHKSDGTTGLWPNTSKYDWTWENVRFSSSTGNKPWYPRSENTNGKFSITSGPDGVGTKYIPQLKIEFNNTYYYIKISLEELLKTVNAKKSISISLSSGKYSELLDIISFSGTKDGNPITIDLNTTLAFGGNYGWQVNSVSQFGMPTQWDSYNGVYPAGNKTEFDDLYVIQGIGSPRLSAKLNILSNIDLFGTVDSINAKSFYEFFNAPKKPINGWITPWYSKDSGLGYIILDWSYNLVLKNRLLPYDNKTFLPITDLTQRNFLQGTNDSSSQYIYRFARNKSPSTDNLGTTVGYNVGVRIYNDDTKGDAIWDKGPWENNQLMINYYKTNRWTDINNEETEWGKYYKRNSMAHEFSKSFLDDMNNNKFLDNYLTNEWTALPVGLVLE